MKWLILDTQAEADALNDRIVSAFSLEKPYSHGMDIAEGIAMPILGYVLPLLTPAETSMLIDSLPPQEVEDVD
jgi:hypothetical protein